MNSIAAPKTKSGRRYVVAMLLGTTLSALGAATAQAVPTPETTLRAVTDMSRYCTTCWRNAHLPPDCWTDCTQEVLCRLMERVDPEAWSQVLKAEGDERKEFLRAIDAVKKRSQRRRKWNAGSVESVPDRHDVYDRQLAEDREVVRQTAEKVLSSRQQSILQMSFDGWTVQEIAVELKLPAERVSDEKYKAIRKLRERLGTAEHEKA